MSFGAAAAVVATIAGIATVHAFRPPSGQSDAPSKVERQVVPEHLSAVRGAPASFEANRPPVPILRTDRPRKENIAGASGNGVSRDDSAAPASAFSSEGIARAAIERDGYKSVSSLRRRSDGSWSGRALRGSVQIEVTVDPAGRVAAN